MLACEREQLRVDRGAVGLADRGEDARLRRMDDVQLELEHARIAELIRREGLQHAWDHSKCLLEMARRGGDRWTSFLRRELELARDATGALVPLKPGASTAESPGDGWWSAELGEQFALPAGEYSLELVYAADREEIAFAHDVSGLVVVRSARIPLAVLAAE
jgi:hypothetical protein